MDLARLEHLAAAALLVLKDEFGLDHWEIGLACLAEPADEDGSHWKGRCDRMVDYELASIVLNAAALADEDDALRTLRHELFHVVLAPFDLYASAVDRLTLPRQAAEVLDRLKRHSLERAVAALERLCPGRAAHTTLPQGVTHEPSPAS